MAAWCTAPAVVAADAIAFTILHCPLKHTWLNFVPPAWQSASMVQGVLGCTMVIVHVMRCVCPASANIGWTTALPTSLYGVVRLMTRSKGCGKRVCVSAGALLGSPSAPGQWNVTVSPVASHPIVALFPSFTGLTVLTSYGTAVPFTTAVPGETSGVTTRPTALLVQVNVEAACPSQATPALGQMCALSGWLPATTNPSASA